MTLKTKLHYHTHKLLLVKPNFRRLHIQAFGALVLLLSIKLLAVLLEDPPSPLLSQCPSTCSSNVEFPIEVPKISRSEPWLASSKPPRTSPSRVITGKVNLICL